MIVDSLPTSTVYHCVGDLSTEICILFFFLFFAQIRADIFVDIVPHFKGNFC
jgi:hypothetical protein